jgi:hypothetical protein
MSLKTISVKNVTCVADSYRRPYITDSYSIEIPYYCETDDGIIFTTEASFEVTDEQIDTIENQILKKLSEYQE